MLWRATIGTFNCRCTYNNSKKLNCSMMYTLLLYLTWIWLSFVGDVVSYISRVSLTGFLRHIILFFLSPLLLLALSVSLFVTFPQWLGCFLQMINLKGFFRDMSLYTYILLHFILNLCYYIAVDHRRIVRRLIRNLKRNDFSLQLCILLGYYLFSLYKRSFSFWCWFREREDCWDRVKFKFSCSFFIFK